MRAYSVRFRSLLVVAVLALLGGGPSGCSKSEPSGIQAVDPATSGAGGSGGSRGSKGGSGGSAKGGSGADASGATGDAAGQTETDGGTGGSGAASTSDDASGGGDDAGPGDDAGSAGPGGSADGSVGTGDDGGDAPGNAGGPILACWPDPKVIHICRQLENACENCGPMKGFPSPKNPKADPCFALVIKAKAGKATDADCAAHALANDCTVDDVTTTGNVCGSLACNPTTCGGTFGAKKRSCLEAQQWGASDECMHWYAKCPCK